MSLAQPRNIHHIFVWDQAPTKYEFKVALGDINGFKEHISQWQQPESPIFFRRNGVDAKWADLESHDSFSNGNWPPLPVLPNQNPESEEAFDRAQRWLADCTKRHKECARPRSRLPKRVLDLGTSEELSKIALYITKGEIAPYATLTYSWGKASKSLKTKDDTIDQHCSGIPLEKSSKTLRDAVRVTKALGYQYLWIDALCIIQDNNADWAEQGAAMTDIYGGSTLNISASSSGGRDEGILAELPNHGFQIGSYYHPDAGDGCGIIFVGPPMKILDLEEQHISSRGWAFQERLVSAATLHYTEEGMIWECANGIRLEHNQNLRNFEWKADWKALMDRRSHAQANALKLSPVGSTAKDQYDSWNEWVCEYSNRNLYDWGDKFPAIAGVAKTFANLFQLTYVAGLWREETASGLLWQRHNRTPTLKRFNKYVAPSWSWASVHGRLEYRNIKIISSNTGPNLKVIHVDIEEEHPGTFGQVRRGRIDAKGLLQKVVIDRGVHPGVRKKPFQECGIAEGFLNNTNIHCMLDEYVESAEPRYACWCLRIGSYDAGGREATLFLLLEQVKACENEFRRVGLAETDPWQEVTSDTVNSGLFVSGQWSRVALI
jgi:hypothetical protein